MLEGVAAVEDAEGVTSLAGDTVLVATPDGNGRAVASLWRASMIISRSASNRIMTPPATAR